MKKILFYFVIFCFLNGFSQQKMITYSFEEVEQLHQKNPKPILIFITTDWCKVCFGMKQTTFKNNKIIKLLNTQFYVIELNAEEKKDIFFIGKTFKNSNAQLQNGIHELAVALATKNNQISYPTTIILNTMFEIDFQISGYLNSKKMTTYLENYEKDFE